VYRDDPLATAAHTLCDEHVGALVVLAHGDPLQRPVGILTDRDVVRGQLGRGADIYCLTVGDVMTPSPLVLPSSMEVSDAIEALGERAVRRAPVVDSTRALMGIVTLDDLLPALAADIHTLARLLGSLAHHERIQTR
jgi:CBS domain-containing protein